MTQYYFLILLTNNEGLKYNSIKSLTLINLFFFQNFFQIFFKIYSIQYSNTSAKFIYILFMYFVSMFFNIHLFNGNIMVFKK